MTDDPVFERYATWSRGFRLLKTRRTIKLMEMFYGNEYFRIQGLNHVAIFIDGDDVLASFSR